VAAVGQPAGPLTLFGASCIAGDAVRQAETGRLAGSCLTLAAAARNLRAWLPALADEVILDAAAVDAAAAVGCADRCGRIGVGRPADLVVLDGDWRLRAVVVGGEVVSGS